MAHLHSTRSSMACIGMSCWLLVILSYIILSGETHLMSSCMLLLRPNPLHLALVFFFCQLVQILHSDGDSIVVDNDRQKTKIE